MTPYASLADDFYVNMNLATEMELPSQRETILHFFERLQKNYPTMRKFYCRDKRDYVLEEDKDQGRYRWAAVESKRLCSGQVNPSTLEAALDRVSEIPGGRVINFEPSLTVALDEDCRTQVRISTETRTNAFQVRTGEFSEDQLSVYVTARQYGSLDAGVTYADAIRRLARIAQDVVDSCVIEQILKPLARTISIK